LNVFTCVYNEAILLHFSHARKQTKHYVHSIFTFYSSEHVRTLKYTHPHKSTCIYKLSPFLLDVPDIGHAFGSNRCPSHYICMYCLLPYSLNADIVSGCTFGSNAVSTVDQMFIKAFTMHRR